MKSFVVAISLWSWGIAWAIPHTPFAFMSNEEKVKSEQCGNGSEIANMPRVRSQDSFPICKAMAAATMLQFQLCKINGVKNCSTIPQEKEVSPLSMLAWIHTDKGEGVPEVRNHENLDFLNSKGTAGFAMDNSIKSFVFLSDSCFPFDQVANKFGLEADEKIEKLIGKIKEEYEKAKTQGTYCEDCLAGAVSELGVNTSITDLKEKLESSKKVDDTAAEFLYRLMMKGCPQITLRPSQRPKLDNYPKKGDLSPGRDKKSQAKNYDLMMEKVKSVLSSGNPIAFDGICLLYDEKNNCTGGHSVAISGYRKVCKKSSECKTECRDMLKIQNSWGTDWQKQNDDGWVDAKSLLSYATDNPKLMENAFSWYY